mmetsp:Transcript_103464/g.331742  ORF Transcript_103464/g.331742 Transcript_103464/m.331742 type:complete len:367 (-) Transcript_103464:641-1741(-)
MHLADDSVGDSLGPGPKGACQGVHERGHRQPRRWRGAPLGGRRLPPPLLPRPLAGCSSGLGGLRRESPEDAPQPAHFVGAEALAALAGGDEPQECLEVEEEGVPAKGLAHSDLRSEGAVRDEANGHKKVLKLACRNAVCAIAGHLRTRRAEALVLFPSEPLQKTLNLLDLHLQILGDLSCQFRDLVGNHMWVANELCQVDQEVPVHLPRVRHTEALEGDLESRYLGVRKAFGRRQGEPQLRQLFESVGKLLPRGLGKRLGTLLARQHFAREDLPELRLSERWLEPPRTVAMCLCFLAIQRHAWPLEANTAFAWRLRRANAGPPWRAGARGLPGAGDVRNGGQAPVGMPTPLVATSARQLRRHLRGG